MNFDTPTEKLAFSLVYSLFGGYIGEDNGTDNRDRFLSTEKKTTMNRFIGFFKRIIDRMLKLARSFDLICCSNIDNQNLRS